MTHPLAKAPKCNGLYKHDRPLCCLYYYLLLFPYHWWRREGVINKWGCLNSVNMCDFDSWECFYPSQEVYAIVYHRKSIIIISCFAPLSLFFPSFSCIYIILSPKFFIYLSLFCFNYLSQEVYIIISCFAHPILSLSFLLFLYSSFHFSSIILPIFVLTSVSIFSHRKSSIVSLAQLLFLDSFSLFPSLPIFIFSLSPPPFPLS